MVGDEALDVGELGRRVHAGIDHGGQPGHRRVLE